MNLTILENATPSANQTQEDLWGLWPIFTFTAFGIIGSITSIINLWIVASIVLSKQLHSVSNILLASLCISEFLAGIKCIWAGFMYSVPSTEQRKHVVGAFIAYVYFVTCSFVFNLVAIGTDRYVKVSRPLKYIHLALPRRCAFVIAVLWSVSAIIGLVMYTSVMIFIDGETTSMKIFFDNDSQVSRLSIYIMNIVAFPCITAIVCLMVALIRIARRQQQKINRERQLLVHLRSIRPPMENNSARPVRLQPARSHHKITVYFIVNFLVFLIAWLPVAVVINVAVFLQPDTIAFDSLIRVFVILVLGQMFLGTILLTYTQTEHRQVVRKAWRLMKLRYSCK